MSKRLRRILYSSSLALAIAFVGAVQSRQMNINAKSTVTKISHHRNKPILKQAYQCGYKSSNNFYKNLVDNYLGSISLYTSTTFKNSPQIYNQRYAYSYIKGFNNLANRPRHGGSFNQQNHGYLMNLRRYRKALKIHSFLVRKPYAYYRGFKDYVYNTGVSNSQNIPKRYRNNLDYAKGYLLHDYDDVSTLKQMDDLFGENQYSNYQNIKGNVKYALLLSPHYKYLYHLYWLMIEHDEYNALTSQARKNYESHYEYINHLNVNDKKFFNYLRSITYENMGYNNADSISTGKYIWDGTNFARNLIRKAPFMQKVYYTKWAINYTDGPLSNKSAFDGVILGMLHNDTKSARHTTNMLHYYLVNKYFTSHKKRNNSFIKQFQRNYRIVPITEAVHVSGHKLDYTKGVSIYHIYNKHAKHSMVAYYIPDGKGPLGWLPDENG